MKAGRSLQDFSLELLRQSQSKKDYIVKPSALEMVLANLPAAGPVSLDSIVEQSEAAPQIAVRLKGVGEFGVRHLAHQQIAEFTGIPKPYYDRMRNEAPALLIENVGHWLRRSADPRMCRMLDGDLRALLSNKYRPLDHLELAEAIFPVVCQPGFKVETCELTETKMYIKVLSERIKFDKFVRPGTHRPLHEVVQAGIVISNSEVGMGRLTVEPLVFVLSCSNGLIVQAFGTRKTHVGGRQNPIGEGQVPEEWLRDETRAADDKAFFMKVQDIVKASFDEAKFAVIANKISAAADREIPANVPEVVEVAQKKFGLSDAEGKGVLDYLTKGGQANAWGLSQAITRYAQDVESFDRSVDLERAGGAVVEMPQPDWARMLKDAGQLAEAA